MSQRFPSSTGLASLAPAGKAPRVRQLLGLLVAQRVAPAEGHQLLEDESNGLVTDRTTRTLGDFELGDKPAKHGAGI